MENSHLITFIKRIETKDNKSAGYLLSSIRILSKTINNNIFIESYSEKLQKYYVFIVSGELFNRLTDINVVNFHPLFYF